MTRTAFPVNFPNMHMHPKPWLEEDIQLGDLHWNFREKNVLIITGASGTGKSSLAKEIAKEFNIGNLSVGFIDANGLIPISHDELARNFSSENFQRSKEELGIENLFNDPSVWSNGQRQRLLLAICLEMEVDLIILDEGLAALGEKDLGVVMNLLRRENIPLILISHHIDFTSSFPDAQIHSL